MDSVEDQLNHIRTEWNVLKEKWFYGETVDPVFEGMVKDFLTFDHTMQDVYKKVELFMKGVDSLAEGLLTLSESVTSGLARVDDSLIVSDSCKLKEATNQITRADAPHSAIAKLRRDMDFNIMNPIRNHLVNNRNMRSLLDKRRRRLTELNSAKKGHDECVRKNLSMSDRRFLQAKSTLESAKMAFHEVDKHVFEWLYILEEYRGDILDSTLQTLKYLQYEFFATSAHAVSSVLPSRMEFRPMVEMTPEHLEAQVEVELQEAEEGGEEEVVTDFSVRLIEKLAKDNKNKPGDGLDSGQTDSGPPLPVDPLSLSSLLSQGFEEGPARRALRIHHNDTQSALDWLINGGTEGSEAAKTAQVEDGVRMPTTIKRIQKLKAMRRAQQEKLRREEPEERSKKVERQAEQASEPEKPVEKKPVQEATSRPAKTAPTQNDDLLGFDEKPATAAGSTAAGGAPMDLLNMMDEPPPPTDFTREMTTTPLPQQRSFDPSQCEKPPLSASVAAGTSLPRTAVQSDAPMMPDLTAAAPAAASTASVTPQFAAQLAAQANITPEQLLLAAQQLAVAQGAGGGATSTAAGGGYPTGSPALPQAPASNGLGSLQMPGQGQTPTASSGWDALQMPAAALAATPDAPVKKDGGNMSSLDSLVDTASLM
mmetsp:Transcript_132076/g.232663  ORF Transcript_132076/g.232663 Transcript_132076/m.232663 type:complete len:651 (+) Transcript_132076:183-2135(+)